MVSKIALSPPIGLFYLYIKNIFIYLCLLSKITDYSIWLKVVSQRYLFYLQILFIFITQLCYHNTSIEIKALSLIECLFLFYYIC